MFIDNKKAIIIGASSGLGKELVFLLSEKKIDLVISSRNTEDLEVIAKHNRIVNHNSIEVIKLDLESLNHDEILSYVNTCYKINAYYDYIFITSGIIDENDNGIYSANVVDKIMYINSLNIYKIVNEIAIKQKDKYSNITVISSIAAIRARSNNMVYSSSKISLEFLISGLRHYYHKDQIIFQIYRAGYLNTVMTRGKKLLFPVADPRKFAVKIYNNRKKDFGIRYYPFFWNFIAIIIQLTPWFLYKKLKF
jgi:short-subunit dehydrogenase